MNSEDAPSLLLYNVSHLNQLIKEWTKLTTGLTSQFPSRRDYIHLYSYLFFQFKTARDIADMPPQHLWKTGITFTNTYRDLILKWRRRKWRRRKWRQGELQYTDQEHAFFVSIPEIHVCILCRYQCKNTSSTWTWILKFYKIITNKHRHLVLSME